MRKTKIVCTIGPASDDKETLRQMILAGMNVARLNFSHGSHEEHRARVERLKALREEMKAPLAIMLDTKGPEIRIGRFKDGAIQLNEGDTFTLTTQPREGGQDGVTVSHEKLPLYVRPGNSIMLDDGLIGLAVESVDGENIVCRVQNGGPLSNNKSVNLPGIDIDMPYLSDQDRADIRFAVENELDYIALSFVRTAQDVMDVKRLLAQYGETGIELIAKIENRSGITHIDEIIRLSAGIMVARGDMGVEIPFEELPHIQKQLITKCYSAGKRVITATQMLESMVRNARPTRAEITDVANAIYDGTSALMLSGETANGKYPVETIRTMAKIAERTEQFIDYRALFNAAQPQLDKSVINAISHATCTTAHDLNAAAIVTVTRTGSTARMVSRFRPATPIVAITPNPRTYRQLALSWGVTPIMNDYKLSSRELFQDAAAKVQEADLAHDGDIIVVTGSSDRVGEITNTLQIHVLGTALVRGAGNGLSPVTGRLCIVTGPDDMKDFHDGDILVIDRTTGAALHEMRRAIAVVTEEDMADSGAASACLALDLPLIAGAEKATQLLKTGCLATIDAKNGVVYNGDSSHSNGK
jgi:pyruvate kinase